MAYAQWGTFTITPKGDIAKLTVKNVSLAWGKFYKDGNKDDEVATSTIENHKIDVRTSYTISSCGRSDASSGTEGSFDLYDGDTKVGHYYWDCPWGSKQNHSTWTPQDSSPTSPYVTQVTGGNLDSGALGNVYINCVKV